MSCAECNKWDTCDNVDCPCNTLLRPCFEGHTLRLDVSEVQRYVRLNKQYHKMDKILIGAVKKTDRRFEITAITVKGQDGGKYICNVEKIEAYYVSNSAKFSCFINGIDCSFTREQFNRLFGLRVTREVANSRLNPYFTPKTMQGEKAKIQKEEEEYEEAKRLAKERRHQRAAQSQNSAMTIEDKMQMAYASITPMQSQAAHL